MKRNRYENGIFKVGEPRLAAEALYRDGSQIVGKFGTTNEFELVDEIYRRVCSAQGGGREVKCRYNFGAFEAVGKWLGDSIKDLAALLAAI